jgi:hypothetical protein
LATLSNQEFAGPLVGVGLGVDAIGYSGTGEITVEVVGTSVERVDIVGGGFFGGVSEFAGSKRNFGLSGDERDDGADVFVGVYVVDFVGLFGKFAAHEGV